MQIVLYILLGVLVLGVAGYFWFTRFYLKVPKLNIPEGLALVQASDIFDQWLQGLYEQGKFNGTVLMAQDGNPLLKKGYGFTSFRMDKELTADSSLRLASLSKQFTAVGIMLLQEKGQLEYDHPVSKYIAGFPYAKVTVRHLLNHTSGIPDNYLKLAKRNKKEIEILTNEEATRLIIKENQKAKHQPNEHYQYSNTNYILLARIIEVVTSLSFEDYMQKELFSPLGMRNTRVWNLLSKEPTFTNKADDFEHFVENDPKGIEPTFIDGVAGDGAVFSSASDLLIWDGFWYDNALLSANNIAEAFKKPVLNKGSESNYGFGFGINPNKVWHNGAWLGARTILLRNPERRTCLAILDNSSNIYFDNIAKELMGHL